LKITIDAGIDQAVDDADTSVSVGLRVNGQIGSGGSYYLKASRILRGSY
jgi:hypothetical protein